MLSVNKNEKNIINKLCQHLELGKTIEVKRFKSSQNEVFMVITEKEQYVVKKYSKDAIKNYYDLGKRKLQIDISQILLENNINTIVPIKFKNKYFIRFKGDYFLIYPYYNYMILKNNQLTEKEIIKLAETLANIHKLNLQYDLPCQYKKINIDFNKYLKEYETLDKKLYDTLKLNLKNLNSLVKECNNNLKELKQELCISHNDYKLLNILWDNEEMYLLDFDATAMSNPYVCLAESAFVFAKQKGVINKKLYKLFIKKYFEIKPKGNIEYKKVLNVAMNGKLQWLSYIMAQCIEDRTRIGDVINMIESLMLYERNKKSLYKFYVEVMGSDSNRKIK